jgi:PAS domain S-box-containing protein
MAETDKSLRVIVTEDSQIPALERELREAAARREKLFAEEKILSQANLLDAVEQAVIATDLEGIVIYWNKFAERLYGWRTEEAVGRSVTEATCPECSREQADEILQSLKEGKSWSGEFIVHRRDGKAFPASVHDSPIFDRQGNLAGIVGISSDITERRLAEEKLRKSERLRAEAQEVGRIGSWEWDVSKDQITWSDELYKLFGIMPEQFVPTFEGFLDWVHPKDESFVRKTVNDALINGSSFSFECRMLRPDGSIWFQHSRGEVVQSSSGKASRMVGIGQDITERMQMQQTLREKQQTFTAFMDNLPAFAWIKDVAGKYVFFNKHFEQLQTPKRMDRLGKTDHELWPPEIAAVYVANDRTVLATKSMVRAVEKYCHGKKIGYALVSKFPLLDPKGNIKFLAGVGVDISDLKRTEEDLRSTTERLQMLSARLLEVQETERRQIASELHDEVGQALTAAQINLGRALRDTPQNSFSRSHLKETILILDQLLQQVRDLSLDLRPSILDDLGLRAALDWYINRHSQHTGLKIFLRCGVGEDRFPPAVETACFRIAQEAITNIARHAKAGRVEVELQRNGDALILGVHDDGIGFEVEAARKRATAGKSLGLLGMAERVTLLGCLFEIKSVIGRGTEICARFPLPSALRNEEAGHNHK